MFFMKQEDVTFNDVDILGSIEFDLSEAIKDLNFNIKTIKDDVDRIKNHLKMI